MKIRAFVIGLLLLFLGAMNSPAIAALVDAHAGEITTIYSFSEYGGGDVIINVQVPAATCSSGYWLRMSDPGAKTIYAQLLAAYHTKTRVRIQAHDEQIWAGSAGLHCRIYVVGYLP